MQAFLEAQIKKVAVSAREKDGTIRRACRLVLFREFDDRVAAALGGKSKAVLRQLKDHDLSDATIGIDAIIARLTISVAGEQVVIPVVKGVRAKAKEGKDAESPPTIQLIWNFDFHEEGWSFLGKHATAAAMVTFEPAQQELASDDGAEAEEPAKKTRGRRKASTESEDNGASVEAH